MGNQDTPMHVLSKIVDKHIKKIELLEKIALGLFGIGILIFYTNAIVYIMAFGGILLSMSYFLMAFRSYKFEDSKESESVLQSHGMILFLSKLNYMALSIGVMGLMFFVTGINGYMQMVLVSILTLVICTIVLIIRQFHQITSEFGKGLLIRNIIVILGLGLTLLF